LSAQVAFPDSYCLTGSKGNFFEGAAIFSQGDLTVRAAIEIIENDLRQAPLGDPAEVANIHDAR
jgi:hypothetical protein